MMKKRMAVLVATGALCLSVSSGGEARSLGFSGGFSRMFQANWSQDMTGMNDHISYKLDTRSFTKLEGNFCDRRSGLSLGADIDIDDNHVSRLNRVLGYIGYKNMAMRFQQGELSGTAHWDGAVGAGQSRDVAFEHNLTHVDLLFWKGGAFFWGFGYTSFALPVEVRTLTKPSVNGNVRSGVAVFDKDFRARFYSILFGMDTFSSNLLYFSRSPGKKRFGMFISGEDRIGFGSSQMGSDAGRLAQQLNPGTTAAGDSFFAVLIENDTSIGFSYADNVGKLHYTLGIGYEVSFISNFNFGSNASNPGDLGYDIYSDLFRHGPIARVHIVW